MAALSTGLDVKLGADNQKKNRKPEKFRNRRVSPFYVPGAAPRSEIAKRGASNVVAPSYRFATITGTV